jgi:hypothetical protein
MQRFCEDCRMSHNTLRGMRCRREGWFHHVGML